jgi:hypothetical protein
MVIAVLVYSYSILTPNNAATPFFANLAQHGELDCPLFGLSLLKNSTGSLSLGQPI